MSTMNCLVCGKPMANNANDCPHCKFHYLSFIGGSLADALEAQKPKADYYRSNTYLPTIDLGITCYHWKDDNGTIALASTERLSFGSAASLENKTVWLNQDFARLPDEEKLTVEVSVKEQGAADRTLQFTLPALKEAELQRLGLQLDSSMKLTLKLKTASGKREVASDPVALLSL